MVKPRVAGSRVGRAILMIMACNICNAATSEISQQETFVVGSTNRDCERESSAIKRYSAIRLLKKHHSAEN